MVQSSDADAGFANLAINHIMKRLGSQFAGYESTTQSLCGKVDLVQSQVRQLENTVASFWREIDAKLEITRSSAVGKSTTEVGTIKDPSKTVGAIPACEFGQAITTRGKADISASNQEYQDPLNPDQRPNVPTEGQDSSVGIFHGSLRQRLDYLAKLVSTQQVGHTATTDSFNKVFEMLQSASDQCANIVSKQDLEALRVGTSRDLEIFRRTLRQDLEADRRAIVQDFRTLFEELRQNFRSFRGETKQDLKAFSENHEQHMSTTGHRLKEGLAKQANTLEAFRSSEKCIKQELSSVRDTLKELEEVVTARLPGKEDQPEVAKERSPALSFAQIVKISYDPSDGVADTSKVGIHVQGQSIQTLQSITRVTQTCNDADLKIASPSRERVDDRAKAPEELAAMHSNEICPKTLASLLRSYMSSTSPSLGRSQEPSISPTRSRAISEEKPAQQVLGREDVQTEARSSLDREKRQKKHKSKHRVDVDGVFGPKQLLSRTPALVSSRGELHMDRRSKNENGRCQRFLNLERTCCNNNNSKRTARNKRSEQFQLEVAGPQRVCISSIPDDSSVPVFQQTSKPHNHKLARSSIAHGEIPNLSGGYRDIGSEVVRPVFLVALHARNVTRIEARPTTCRDFQAGILCTP